MINFCIIHYNTPRVTECLIRSINKYTPQCHIYVFDNSDKDKFVYKQPNLTIIDNTEQQIINFNKELEKYPSKGGDRTNRYVSFRHCISVDRCMDIIGDNFILLDSDVLLTRDVSDFWDTKSVYVGETMLQPYTENIYRLTPFICFINVKLCKRIGIRYFDEHYMIGLHKEDPVGNKYDTGANFLREANKYNHKDIDIWKYIVHYKGASWDVNKPSNKAFHGSLSPEEWCLKNKEYWYSKNKNVIYRCITGGYESLTDLSYVNFGYDYVCFGDDIEYDGNLWEIRPVPQELKDLDPKKQQRLIKICPHKYLGEYKLSVWIDGNIDIVGDIDEFIEDECSDKNKSVFIPKHPHRKCIYDEVDACARLKKDTMQNMQGQVERYKNEGFPKNFGLVQSGIIIRKHNTVYCKRLMNAWANELMNGSHRDQLSFNYCAWITGSSGFQYLDSTLFKSKYFVLSSGHKHTRIARNSVDFGDGTSIPTRVDDVHVFIMNCGYPWYVKKYEEVFSNIGRVDVIDCLDSKYSKLYERVLDTILDTTAKYIIVVRSNINLYSSTHVGEDILKRFRYIIKKGRDVGIYTPSFVYNGASCGSVVRKKRDGERIVPVVDDGLFLLNTKYAKGLSKFDFSKSPSGAGFIDLLCDKVRHNGGSVVVDDGVYATNQYLRTYSKDILDQHKRAFLRANNKEPAITEMNA